MNTDQGKDSNNEEFEFSAKIILVGDSNVGKTNIILRFAQNKFNDKTTSTVCTELSTKLVIVDGKRIKLNIWDTMGQEKYRALTKNLFNGANGVIVVFDITNYDSFQNVNSWMKDIHEKLGPNIPIFLLGNKFDLDDENIRKVEEFDIKSMEKKYSTLKI